MYCQSCPPGFKGDGISCYPVDREADPCDKTSTNPCYPGSKCQVVNGIVTCGPCPANMTGDGKFCSEIDLVLNIYKNLDRWRKLSFKM